MNFFSDFEDLDKKVRQIEHNEGVYYVPAFNGLFSPHWDENATGIIIGITQKTT